MVDHLFRHQYGKLVAILSKIFGLSQLELIEDAIQDTFLQASLKWRAGQPDDPEAWLTRAAKNRAIDLLRQVNAQSDRHQKSEAPIAVEAINDYFLDHEVEDSQLRMIFVACHPLFSQEEQIAFALKTVSGFSMKEIAAALVQKEETIKKRLSRARKKILESDIQLDYPSANEVTDRMSGVLQIIYLIFNEGFQSTKPNDLIDKELCGEALRLCRLLLVKESFRSGSLYALFALLCLHSARLDTRIVNGELMDLKNQDRSKWHLPLILMGNQSLDKATTYPDQSLYLWEACIAAEHVKAIQFENTDWSRIVEYYDRMLSLLDSDHIRLSKAIAFMQLGFLENAKHELDGLDPNGMNQRLYLLYGAWAEYYHLLGDKIKAIEQVDMCLSLVNNDLEKNYIQKKRRLYSE